MPIQELKTERQVTVGVYTMSYEADIVWSLLEAFEIPVFYNPSRSLEKINAQFGKLSL